MDLNKKKILRIILVAIISLSLMFAGQWFYSKRVMENGLIRVLSDKAFVDHVDIKKEQDKAIITVELKNVDNIKEVYTDIYDSANHHLKGRSFELKISNKPDAFLEDLFNNNIQFILYEALYTGEFNKMKTQLDNLQAKNQSTDIKVFLDSENLYLQLKHDKSDFYDVLKRVN